MNLLKKLIIVLAALFIAQGVKAQITNPFAYDDVWNGSTTTRPQFYSTYEGKSNVFVINTAAELVWIRNNWDEPSGRRQHQQQRAWCHIGQRHKGET